MPETIDTPTVTADSIETDIASVRSDHDIDTIGVEFEYPTGSPIPSRARGSGGLRREVGFSEWDLSGYVPNHVPTGEMTSDHVGAEITSARMDLHSDQPELWYAGTIQRAEEMGYRFARTGYGDTVFGLHLHLSQIPEGKARALFDMCQEPWMKVFACSSISEDSCDPWRHGGVGSAVVTGERTFEHQYVVNPRVGTGHYEWRLPEPMAMDHFMVMMNFLRRLEDFGADNAEEYARGLVEDADTRLTAVKQYLMMEASDDYDFPNERMVNDEDGTTPETAEYFRDIMQSR